MNRTGLLIALAIAGAVGIAFGLHSELDLKISSLFLNPDANGRLVFYPRQTQFRNVISWLIAAIAAPAFLALVVKLVRPPRPMLLPGRAVVLLIATIAIGPGLIANALLKGHSGRWRPHQVTELGGSQHFHAWWDMRGSCPQNCSFVSGEAAGAYWTMTPAALTPPPWRVVAYGAALAFGTAIGVLRMSAGSHFATDVVFAGVFVFLVIWLMHGLLYRWAATRTTDEAVERAIERIAIPVHDAIAAIAARIRGRSAGDR
jgi:membrane-associated PAP2 superfamily phosphatase